jgi:hypothetical protein
MAKADHKSNPFGWILLGVLVGAVATIGVILVATSMGGGYEEGPEIRTAADTAALPPPAEIAPVAPPRVEPSRLPTNVDAPPTLPENPVDAQMADDAAAAGMTSRTPAPQ